MICMKIDFPDLPSASEENAFFLLPTWKTKALVVQKNNPLFF